MTPLVLAIIGIVTVAAVRQLATRVSRANPSLGSVSQNWLAEDRAAETNRF